MPYSKTKKLIIAILFSVYIFFGNVIPGVASQNYYGSEITEKTDSTATELRIETKTREAEKKKEVQKSSGTNYTYNIIYYLLMKFILINPFSRPS